MTLFVLAKVLFRFKSTSISTFTLLAFAVIELSIMSIKAAEGEYPILAIALHTRAASIGTEICVVDIIKSPYKIRHRGCFGKPTACLCKLARQINPKYAFCQQKLL